MVPTWLLWLYWFILGSAIGSFLNVCIYRMPREQSIVSPRSRCPNCQHPIAWYDNIPVASFFILGRKCRHCRCAIRWRYPVVEALTGVLTAAVFERFGTGPIGLVYLGLVCGLIASSFIDLEFQIIPDEISLGVLVIGVLLSIVLPVLHGTDSRLLSLSRSVTGLLVGGGLLYGTGAAGNVGLWGLRCLGVRVRHNPFWRAKLARYRHMKESMGGGDVKLLAMAGSILGWKYVALTFFLAPLVAVIPGITMLLLKRTHYIPYGPFLSLGLVVALFFGNDLIRLSGIEETTRLLWTFYGPR